MKYLGLLSVCLLTACANHTIVEPDQQDRSQENTVITEGEPQRPIAPAQPAIAQQPPQPTPISIAAESLAQLARSQYQARQYQSAIATAERGLRIDRRASSLYLVLAQSYMQLGLPNKANNFVQQGLRYAIAESDTEIQLLRLRDILAE